MMRRVALAAGLLILTACSRSGSEAPPGLAGTWRAVVQSPGGELPFTLRIEEEGKAAPAVAINGGEESPFTSVHRDGNRVTLRVEHYDAQIDADLLPGGDVLEGSWSRTDLERIARLPFRAVRNEEDRFRDEPSAGAGTGAGPGTVDGAWEVVFTEDTGTFDARAEFRQDGERVLGTFLTPTGDFRYLEGDYRHGLLRLSTFDGSHVFLFRARGTPDGRLEGDFWSRDVYHATWVGRRAADDAPASLLDGFERVGVASADGRLHFSFPDLSGRPVSPADARFRGRVLIVQLFGSWCPNCNDEAPLLADWYRRYRERGLEMIGVAFEFTHDAERNRRFVQRYGERHGIEYPLLLGGTADRGEREAAIADLSGVEALPTTLFVGRDGTVRYVHSGFAGPGTGRHHQALVADFQRRIEELLEERE